MVYSYILYKEKIWVVRWWMVGCSVSRVGRLKTVTVEGFVWGLPILERECGKLCG